MSDLNINWAIVELLGHVRMAGILTEEERFGVKLGRVDIPIEDRFVTQFFGGSSVYRITPCSEEVGRSVAAANIPRPVNSREMPKQIETREPMDGTDEVCDEDDDSEEHF